MRSAPGKYTVFCFAAIAILALAYIFNGDHFRGQAVANASTQKAAPWDFSTASNKFGVELLHELRKSNKDQNVVISPASISVALAMLLNGADTQTLSQTAKLLGVDVKDLLSMNVAVSAFLDSAIQADPDVELEIANGIFAQKGKTIDAKFMKTVQKDFQGRVKELDFENDAQVATDKINSWVSQKTNGRIPTLFDSLSKDTVMVVGSAAHFQSSWLNPFDESLTKERDFILADGTKIPVATMYQYGTFSYVETSDFQSVSLGCGSDGRFLMDVYLPKAKITLDDLAKKLSADALARYADKHSNKFFHSPVELYLPKMTIYWSLPLNGTLVDLGMKDPFNQNKADFSKLFANKKDKCIAVDIFQHHMVLEVNEKGTGAAAVNGINLVAATSAATEIDGAELIVMDVNRPFFIVIRDSETGVILFIGTVYYPQETLYGDQ